MNKVVKEFTRRRNIKKNDIHSLFNNLNIRLDRDFVMQTLKLKQETSVEIAQSIEKSESKTMKVIQKNNANLPTAITQIINIVAKQGSIDLNIIYINYHGY